MARYTLRDFPIQTSTSGSGSEAQAYLLAIFLRRVLGYSLVGHTNFNIETIGTLLLASGTGAGNRAGINFGAGAVYEVSIPVGVRAVSAGDIGRILVLKSTANPLHNAGLFLITGVNTTDNRYVIDWRSADSPPAEAADSMDWWLYAADANRPAAGATNASTNQYRGNGTSATPRIVLQSPHASGWQVRICVETSTDAGNTVTNQWTACPGFGADSAGDFQAGGRHLHAAQWYNTSVISNTSGVVTPGMGHGTTATTWRFTVVGDDTGQSVVVICRKVSTGTNHGMLVLGIPDNEPAPLPTPDPVHRLFMWGQSNQGSAGAWSNNISFTPGLYNGTALGQGLAMGLLGQPIALTPSCWTYLNGGNPFADSLASDSPYSSTTELFTVDLVTGTVQNWVDGLFVASSGSKIAMPLEVRTLGTMPWLRHGRSNFTAFTLTSDAGKSWYHLSNGVYLQWGGPAVLV